MLLQPCHRRCREWIAQTMASSSKQGMHSVRAKLRCAPRTCRPNGDTYMRATFHVLPVLGCLT